MDFLVENATWLALAASLIGLGFAFYQRTWILSQDAGNSDMQRIADAIQRGAQAFLRREYRSVAILGAIVVVVLLLLSAIPDSGMSPWTAVAFVTGASASGVALKIMQENEGIDRLCRNGWVQVATQSPESEEIQLFNGERFEPYEPQGTPLPEVSTSAQWYRGWRDHLGFARIKSPAPADS